MTGSVCRRGEGSPGVQGMGTGTDGHGAGAQGEGRGSEFARLWPRLEFEVSGAGPSRVIVGEEAAEVVGGEQAQDLEATVTHSDAEVAQRRRQGLVRTGRRWSTS